MNIDKIKEALDDAIEAKKLYQGIDGEDWHFWDGYEQALTYALFHIIRDPMTEQKNLEYLQKFLSM
jgi:hypothetical protein